MVLASIIFLPMMIFTYGLSSLSAGVMVVVIGTIVIHIIGTKDISIKLSAMIFFMLLLIIIICLALNSYIINFNHFNFWKFLTSVLGTLMVVYYIVVVNNYFRHYSDKEFDRNVKVILYVLLLDGIISSCYHFLVGAPFLGHFKPMIFFSEPSLYALTIFPFLMYYILTYSSKTWRVLLPVWLIAITMQSLVLILCLLLATMIAYSKQIGKLTIIMLCIGTILFLFVDMSYYLNRIDISTQSNNLSVLVFISGWERALIAFVESKGLGVGFQQFGYVGSIGQVQLTISKLGAEGLNLYDGGVLGAKVIAEFGVIGLLFIILYIRLFLKILFRLKDESSLVPSKVLFFKCVIIGFAIVLFVRGVGYFSPVVILFVVSLLGCHSYEEMRLRLRSMYYSHRKWSYVRVK